MGEPLLIGLIPTARREVEITSENDVDHSQESDDEEQLRTVVKRMANALKLEPNSCVTKKPKLSRTNGPSQIPKANGKTFPTCFGICEH